MYAPSTGKRQASEGDIGSHAHQKKPQRSPSVHFEQKGGPVRFESVHKLGQDCVHERLRARTYSHSAPVEVDICAPVIPDIVMVSFRVMLDVT